MWFRLVHGSAWNYTANGPQNSHEIFGHLLWLKLRRRTDWRQLPSCAEEVCAGQKMKGRAEMCELSELCELSLLLH
jgi:hypothetical protein